MVGKGFICEVEINLHLLSSVWNHECPGQLVYLTIEMFGKTHKTTPQHAYYPLVYHETVKFQKTFWSASDESDVLRMLRDTSVVIELRRLDPCFYSGLLLSYYDGNARDFLLSRYPRIPSSASDQEIYLERTINFNGTAPRLSYSVFTDIKDMRDSSDFFTSERKHLINTRSDDGYYSPTQSVTFEKTNDDGPSRKSRSRTKSNEYGSNENLSNSKKNYTRQTVSSALRSRSPSPQMNKSMNYNDDVEMIDEEESKKPSFVVRKVPDNLITRSSQSAGNTRQISAKRRSKSKQPSIRTKNGNSEKESEKKIRSSSLSKKPVIEDSVESYKPSAVVSDLRRSYEFPYYCHKRHSVGHCCSAFHNCYACRLTRTSCLPSTHRHCCHSHCSHWVSPCF